MLRFYHQKNNAFTRWVSEELDEMVVAHKIITLTRDDSLPDSLSQNELPVLSDGRQRWTSEEDIRQFLRKLQRELKLSRSLQSDSCHLDPDNPEECL